MKCQRSKKKPCGSKGSTQALVNQKKVEQRMKTPSKQAGGFSMLDLLVLISVLGFTLAMVLPVVRQARVSARQMQNDSQLRALHRGIVVYSQGNRGYFPGLGRDGLPHGGGANSPGDSENKAARFTNSSISVSVSRRYAIMLDAEVISPEYLVSPGDPRMVAVQPDAPGKSERPGSVDIGVYSYAMLCITMPHPRGYPWGSPQADGVKFPPGPLGEEWKDSANPLAIIASDRAIADDGNSARIPDRDPGTFSAYHSIWTEAGSESWAGSALRKDGSVDFRTNADDFTTKYGNGKVNRNDNLFQDETSSETVERRANAWLSFGSGSSTLSPY